MVTFPTFSSEVFFFRVKNGQKAKLENILSNFPFLKEKFTKFQGKLLF
jgi:hypothetical protein